MPSILVEVEERELSVLLRIENFMTQGTGRSPKAYEVVPLKSRCKSADDRLAIATFRRLVTLGAIEHSRNGHCWLTRAGHSLLTRPDVIAEN